MDGVGKGSVLGDVAGWCPRWIVGDINSDDVVGRFFFDVAVDNGREEDGVVGLEIILLVCGKSDGLMVLVSECGVALLAEDVFGTVETPVLNDPFVPPFYPTEHVGTSGGTRS